MSFARGIAEKRRLAKMNQIKVKIYKEILREISANFDGAEQFINERIDKICNREKLSLEEVIYFV